MLGDSPWGSISRDRLFGSRSARIILSALMIRLLYLGIALFEVHQDRPLLQSDLFIVSSVDYWDIERRFYQFATRVYKWQKIPYVNYPLEYPQLAGGLFQLIYSFQPGNLQAFALSLHLIQLPLELLTTVIIYEIAFSIYGERHASTAGLLYNLSPIVLHTWVSRYDAIPVFFTVVSLYLILRKRYTYSFLMIAAGIMFKWYPGIMLLPFLSHMRKNESSRRAIRRSLAVLVTFCLAMVLPFFVMSPQFFLESYVFHLGRGWNYQSLWTLLLLAPGGFFATGISSETVSAVSMFLQSVGCLSVLAFRIKEPRGLIMACAYVIMIFVFFTKFYSPQYAAWFTPLLLLSLAGSYGWLLQILFQISAYVEYPVLWNLRFSEAYPYFYWAVALKFLLLGIGILRIVYLFLQPYPREKSTPKTTREAPSRTG